MNEDKLTIESRLNRLESYLFNFERLDNYIQSIKPKLDSLYEIKKGIDESLTKLRVIRQEADYIHKKSENLKKLISEVQHIKSEIRKPYDDRYALKSDFEKFKDGEKKRFAKYISNPYPAIRNAVIDSILNETKNFIISRVGIIEDEMYRLEDENRVNFESKIYSLTDYCDKIVDDRVKRMTKELEKILVGDSE